MLMNTSEYKDALNRIVDIANQSRANAVQRASAEMVRMYWLVGAEYHLVVGHSDFYIDLLFYNIKLHCYMVVELKNVPFQPEFAGKLGFYVAAVDGELAGEGDGPTIGLLLCKSKDDVVAEYSLQSIDEPIGIPCSRCCSKIRLRRPKSARSRACASRWSLP